MKRNLFILIIALILLVSCIGNQRENSLSEANIKGKVKTLTTYQYDASEKFGQAQKEKLRFTTTNFYNEEGNLTEQNLSYLPSGEITQKRIYEYDEQGNALVKDYNKDGKHQYTYKYIYDKNGKLIESNNFDSDGKRTDKRVTQYDTEGNKIITLHYDENDSIEWKWTYTYENNGKKVTLKAIKPDNSISWINIYTYDDNGNEIEDNTVDANGKISTARAYQYDNFDEQKNWGKRIWIYNGKVNEIVERKIQYFDNVQDNSKKRSSGKKLNQEIAERTIRQFVSANSFGGGGNNWGESGSFSENSISSIEEISQFTETEASSIVHFNYHDAFADGNLVLKFNFKKDINKYWFLTSIEAVSGVGSQGMSDRIYKWKTLNVPVQ